MLRQPNYSVALSHSHSAEVKARILAIPYQYQYLIVVRLSTLVVSFRWSHSPARL